LVVFTLFEVRSRDVHPSEAATLNGRRGGHDLRLWWSSAAVVFQSTWSWMFYRFLAALDSTVRQNVKMKPTSPVAIAGTLSVWMLCSVRLPADVRHRLPIRVERYTYWL